MVTQRRATRRCGGVPLPAVQAHMGMQILSTIGLFIQTSCCDNKILSPDYFNANNNFHWVLASPLSEINRFAILRITAEGKVKMLSINKVAQITGAAKSSLRVRLSNGEKSARRISSTKKTTTPVGNYRLIPESDLKGFEARGQDRLFKPESKPGKAHKKADTSKKASNA